MQGRGKTNPCAMDRIGAEAAASQERRRRLTTSTPRPRRRIIVSQSVVDIACELRTAQRQDPRVAGGEHFDDTEERLTCSRELILNQKSRSLRPRGSSDCDVRGGGHSRAAHRGAGDRGHVGAARCGETNRATLLGRRRRRRRRRRRAEWVHDREGRLLHRAFAPTLAAAL
jgi:hypothetical protein